MLAPLDRFIGHIKVQKRYSDRTAMLYRSAVCDFYCYMQGLSTHNELLALDDFPEKEQLSLLTPTHIRSFIAESLKEGLSTRSVNLKISALSSYCDYLVKNRLLAENPVNLVHRPKVKKMLPLFYEEDVIRRYLLAPLPDNYDDLRDRTIVTALYCTGMRRAEISALKIENYDSARSLFRVVGKGDKEREIPVVPFLSELLAVYLAKREDFLAEHEKSNEPAFFLTNKCNPIYLNFVNNVVKREFSGRCDFGGKNTPHILRHSFATHLLNEGADLNSIKEVMGHTSLAATQVYTHNSFEQLKKVYLTAHPRAKKGG